MVVKKLPYKNLAGITTCPGGWLVLPARMAGVTVAAEEAFVVKNLFDVLDYRPTFDAAAINAPLIVRWRLPFAISLGTKNPTAPYAATSST